MLKPKYGNINESVSDFNRILDGMNKTSPLEYSSYEEVDQIVREEQDLQRIEREVAHMESVLAGIGMAVEGTDRVELSKQYDQVARRYGQAANRAAAQVESAKRGGMNKLFMTTVTEAYDRLLGKAREYKAKHEQMTANRVGLVAEGRDPAVNSQYRDAGSSLERFRVLSGIEEQVAMPRDAGIFGSTRHNANFDEMAQPFSEARTKEQQWKGQVAMSNSAGEIPFKIKQKDSHSDERKRVKAVRDKNKYGANRMGDDPLKSKKIAKEISHKSRMKGMIKKSIAKHRAMEKPNLPEDNEYQEGGGSRRTKEYRQDVHVAKERGLAASPKDQQRTKNALDRVSPGKLKGLHGVSGTKNNDDLARKLLKPSDSQKKDSRRARLYGKRDNIADRADKSVSVKKGDYDDAERYGGSRLEKYPAAHHSTSKAYSALRRARDRRKSGK